jgi:hypothetical protein
MSKIKQAQTEVEFSQPDPQRLNSVYFVGLPMNEKNVLQQRGAVCIIKIL